jgi:hypothetical protein
MHERIKELAEQAYVTTLTTKGHEFIVDGSYIVSPDKLEKFAELIVKECMDIAYEYDAPKMSGPGMIIAGRIESHFGVEE